MKSELLIELKERIKQCKRRNSDRGFVHYGGFNRVCTEMISVMEVAESLSDSILAFDIAIMVQLETAKLLSHGDSSSGYYADVFSFSLDEIDKRLLADEANRKHYFDTLIKTAKNKAFIEYPDYGFNLLKSAIPLVHDRKQAEKIYDIIPLYGTLYDGGDYPDKHIITLGIVRRLDGEEAAERYLMNHLDVTELRKIAVEQALESRNYALAEQLCLEAMDSLQSIRTYRRCSEWAFYLERMYNETSMEDKLTAILRDILFQGEISYYPKLAEQYRKQGIWEERREGLLEELSRSLMSHDYAHLLADAKETEKLLRVVENHPSSVIHYGIELAKVYPDEAYAIYEGYILTEAKEATDRNKYRMVCKTIKNLYDAGGKSRAMELVDRLMQMYPRRSAMLDELHGLRRKLEK